MKAIKTRYFGPGNVKGSRCGATDEDGNSVYLSWDDALNSEGNHRKAAYALRDKMKWSGELVGGALRDCYVWVFLS